MQQFKATDNKIWLSAERNGRPPVLPAIRVVATIEGSAQQADHDNTALSLIHWNTILSYSISNRISDRELFVQHSILQQLAENPVMAQYLLFSIAEGEPKCQAKPTT
jgi:hypothetical protein